MTQEPGVDRLRDFLAGLSEASVGEDQEFSMNQSRAEWVLADALKTESRGYARHLLAAAFLAGSDSFRCYTRSKLVQRYELATNAHRGPSFRAAFEGTVPSELELDELGRLIASRQNRLLYRLTLALKQMQCIPFRLIRLEFWRGDSVEVFAVTPKAKKRRWRRRRPWEKAWEGTRVYLWEAHQSSELLRGKVEVRTGSEERLFLKRCARWSPLKIFIDDEAIANNSIPASAIHSYHRSDPNFPIPGSCQAEEESQGFSLLAWLDPDGSGCYITPVCDGWTYSDYMAPRYLDGYMPGLRLIVHTPELDLDSSWTNLVESGDWEFRLADFLKVGHKFFEALVAKDDDDCRRFLLSREKALSSFEVARLPIVKTPRGEDVSLLWLREQWVLGRRENFDELDKFHRDLVLTALSEVSSLRFLEGYERPIKILPNTRGDRIATLWWTQTMVVDLQKQTPPFFVSHGYSSPVSLHPREPWLSIGRNDHVEIVDCHLRKVIKTFADCNQGLFSSCGRWFLEFDEREKTRFWALPQWELEIERSGLGVVACCEEFVLVHDCQRKTILLENFLRPSSRGTEISTDAHSFISFGDVAPDRRALLLEAGIGGLILADLQSLAMQRVEGEWGRFGADSSTLLVKGANSYLLYRRRPKGPWVREKKEIVHSDGSPQNAVSSAGVVTRWDVDGEGTLQHKELGRLLGTETPRRPDLAIMGDWEESPWSFLVDHQRPRTPFWRFFKPRLSLGQSHLYWSGQNGLHRVDRETGEYTFHPGLGLAGRAVFETRDGSQAFLNPKTLEIATRLDESVRLESADCINRLHHNCPGRFDHLSLGTNKLLIVDAENGLARWEDSCCIDEANQDCLLGRQLNKQREVTFFKCKSTFYTVPTMVGQDCVKLATLHPYKNYVISQRSKEKLGFFWLFGGFMQSVSIPGTHAVFSPTGSYFAALQGDSLRIFETSKRKPLGTIETRPPSSSVSHFHFVGRENSYTWQTDDILLVDGVLWQKDPELGWLSPRLLGAGPPVSTTGDGHTSIVFYTWLGQVHFYDLLKRQTVLTLHAMGDDFMIFTPDGNYDGSPRGMELSGQGPHLDPLDPNRRQEDLWNLLKHSQAPK